MINRRRIATISILALSVIFPYLSSGAAQEKPPKEPAKEQTKETSKKPPKKPRPIRVLFIGGSFIYYNNLPDIFAKLCQAGGAGMVETGMVALPGWSLKDHWQKGDAHKVLRESSWKYVILQDQSLVGAVDPEGRPAEGVIEAFRPYARNWGQVIEDVGAVPIFFMTWARKDTPTAQTVISSALFGVAKEVEAKVAAVGIAWARVQKEHPEIDLYAADGVNPSPAGSYLAACTIYATTFGRNPEGLPGKAGGRPVNLETGKIESEKLQYLVDLSPDQAKVLQQAAWAAKKLLDKNHGYLDVSGPPAR
jgi:hypothetical protein